MIAAICVMCREQLSKVVMSDIYVPIQEYLSLSNEYLVYMLVYMNGCQGRVFSLISEALNKLSLPHCALVLSLSVE